MGGLLCGVVKSGVGGFFGCLMFVEGSEGIQMESQILSPVIKYGVQGLEVVYP